MGDVKSARKLGLIAAYLSLAAIVVALVVACFITGLAIGLWGDSCRRQYNRLRPSYSYYGYYYASTVNYSQLKQIW